MGSREELDHLLAQWHECPVAAEALDRNIAAFKQAMTEFGIPEHPGGQCPGDDCDCMALVEVVTFRAYEILGFPAEAVPEDS